MRELLDDAAIEEALPSLGWEKEDGRLRKTVRRKDFREAMEFVNEVAVLAEEADHHPDLAISWNTVELTLWTHTAGGITQKDLDLARRIDRLG